MMSGNIFSGERYAVVGLGRNGLPVARRLAALGADVAVWDDRLEAPGLPLLTQPFDLRGFTALVLSPGIPHLLPSAHPAADAARAAGVPIISDAELLYVATRRRGSKARFVGITGTNGKSTTTALLHHVLVSAGWESAAGGNLGTAALMLPDLGDPSREGGGVYVLEMSSYMLERLLTLRFDVACLLNLSPDHLDRHGSMAGYAAVKQRIFDRQQAGDTAVLGIDDALTAAIDQPGVRVSGEKPADIWCEGGLLRDAAGVIVAMPRSLPGSHNGQNAAAVAAMALALGMDRVGIAAGIASFAGLPHRQQVVATIDGVPWVNDSKATNADAAARALACYERSVWIAGGIAKAGGIAALAPMFPHVAHALLIGRDAPVLAAQLGDVPFTLCETLDAACVQARAIAPGLGADAVLLSPACASFDQFAGFEARGDRFAALATVKEAA